ncbi:metallophosphoesterase [Deinococcus sp.]|uniref:metallophosphoesterase n=1 Tax=Deinococcus sp. TaxID=47478 RepID=UPI003B5A4526
MRQIVVVPDLHGRLDLLLAAIQAFPEAHFLSLGDAIDRGPRSLGTVDKLLELYDAGRATLLMGNHERMAFEGLRWYRQYVGTHDMADYRKAMEGFQWWMQAGGETVRAELARQSSVSGGTLTLERFPANLARYMGLLRRVVYVTEGGDIHDQPPEKPSVLVAHASPPVRHPQYPNPESAALWLRPSEGPFPLPPNVIYSVHGHTPVRVPTRMNRHLYIDLGAYETGRLALLPLSVHQVSAVTVLCGRGDAARAAKYPAAGEALPTRVVMLDGAPVGR